MKRFFLLVPLLLTSIALSLNAQYEKYEYIPAVVDFNNELQEWDGFGFNYVETAHTYNYIDVNQDYGGFSLLDEQQKEEIVELIFGEGGLKPGIVKMFLDPLHQDIPGGEFDHVTTTKNMREFVKSGLALTHARGDDLVAFTTLYGPPSWATIQKINRGRDLDPEMKEELANYMIDWVKFLKFNENIPVKFISLHNEGEDWQRWPVDGTDGYSDVGHDYNMYWPINQVNDFLKFMPGLLKKEGLDDVSISNGEPTKWYRFSHWGLAEGIVNDQEAIENLGIVMSHDFYNGNFDYWYGGHSRVGLDKIRQKKPDLHAWSTSSAWKFHDAFMIRQLFGSIYDVGINGFIPWAGIQRPAHWFSEKGDPNPFSAIVVSEDSTFKVTKGYYYYKQISRAGQPGMKVAYTHSQDSEIPIIAFSSNNTKNPDCFIVINYSNGWTEPGRYIHSVDKKIKIAVKGSEYTRFKAFRTDKENESYTEIGEFEAVDGTIYYHAPDNSVTTFFGI